MKTSEQFAADVLRRRDEYGDEKKNKMKRFYTVVSASVGALVLALTAVGVTRLVWPKTDPQNTPPRGTHDSLAYVMYQKSNSGAVIAEEKFRLWPWDKLELWEKYSVLEYNGNQYDVRTYYSGADPSLPAETVGKELGRGTVTGYDHTEAVEMPHTAACRVFSVPGADENSIVAAYVEDGADNGVYLVYFNGKAAEQAPASFGELWEKYALSEYLTLDTCYLESGKCVLDAADAVRIRDILAGCADAPARPNDILWGKDTVSASFSVTSRPLGLYGKSFSVSATGYVITNIAEYRYCYEIGTEAAGEIIGLSQKGVPAEPENYTLAGTVSGWGEKFFMLTDSDGDQYTVICNTRTLLRAKETLSDGDLVLVGFDGKLYDAAGDGRYDTVFGAYSAQEAEKAGDGAIVIPE